MDCLAPAVAQSVLQDCLEDGSIIPSKHFREELSKEGLGLGDALYILRTGQIYDPGEQDIKTGEWKYGVEGQQAEGMCFRIIFAFKAVDTAILITIFSIEKRRGVS
jgi:hypothetical protein